MQQAKYQKEEVLDLVFTMYTLCKELTDYMVKVSVGHAQYLFIFMKVD